MKRKSIRSCVAQFTNVSLESNLSNVIIIIIIIIIISSSSSSLLYGVLFNYCSTLSSVCVLFVPCVLSLLFVEPFSELAIWLLAQHVDKQELNYYGHTTTTIIIIIIIIISVSILIIVVIIITVHKGSIKCSLFSECVGIKAAITHINQTDIQHKLNNVQLADDYSNLRNLKTN
jgi:hypothetical protein